MTEPIVNIERLQQEARAAAKTYNNVNDACPYPFGTQAGQVFKAEFVRARAVIESAACSNVHVCPAATVNKTADTAEQAAQ